MAQIKNNDIMGNSSGRLMNEYDEKKPKSREDDWYWPVKSFCMYIKN